MVDKIVFINVGDIIYCEASSAYTNVFLKDDKKMVVSKPLGDFELLLINHRFSAFIILILLISTAKRIPAA